MLLDQATMDFGRSVHKGPYPDGLASRGKLSGGACCPELPRKGSAGQHAGQHCGCALHRRRRLPVSL